MEHNTLYDAFLYMHNNDNFIAEQIKIRNVVYDTKYKKYKMKFDGVEYEFICVMYEDENNNNMGIAYLNNISFGHPQILEDIDEMHPETFEFEIFKAIQTENKKYCVEIMDKFVENKKAIYINWLQNRDDCDIPNNPNTVCKSLKGIMTLIFTFFRNINITGPIYLDDDSMIGGIKTLIPRLLSGKSSIYEAYGFKSTYSMELIQSDLLKIKNIQINGLTVATILPQYVDSRGVFLNGLDNFLNNIQENSEGKILMGRIQKYYLKMINNDISTRNVLCQQIGGQNKNNKLKYIRYRNH